MPKFPLAIVPFPPQAAANDSLSLSLRAGVCLITVLWGSLDRWDAWHSTLHADEPPATNASPVYSDEVVEKAERILQNVGLKRSGKVIQSTATAEISRSLSSLNRTTRELRLVHSAWKQASDQLSRLGRELKRLNIQDGEYNLQLAQVAGVNVAVSNRLVALINANRAKIKALRDEELALKGVVAQKRAELSQAESDYAATVLAIRSDYQDLAQRLRESLATRDVQIAFKVLETRYQITPDWTAEKILATVDKRLQHVEQQIFSESVPLQVEPNGSLYVDVVVGTKTTRMVVDSGATLVSLPMTTAAALDIKIPVDAPRLSLVLADGREIPARRVTLSQVRVGQFEAEQVDAAILDASAIGAEPLLGMSFLGNFKFEIDLPQKSLRMLRIDATEL